MKTINIRPTTSVYATYKNISYHPWTAISEFIDNSTQSFFDNESYLKSLSHWTGLSIEIEFGLGVKAGFKGKALKITDNAYGMNFYDFERAVVLDSPPQTTNRSEFGMGLKTAACWFGANWSVESVEHGSGVKYYTEVDVKKLQKDKDEEIRVHETRVPKDRHGTVITIWNLHRDIVGRQVEKTKKTLTGTYREDLRKKNISITYNGEKLDFEEPQPLKEMTSDGREVIWKKNIQFAIKHNNRIFNVNGFIGLREQGSTRDSGFVLLRYGRAIIGGYENNYRPPAIFGAANSFVYQRLYGELHMDNWDVTQTKDDFDWHNGLEDKFIDQLKEETIEYREKARTYRKNKKSTKEAVYNTVETLKQAGEIDDYSVEEIIEVPEKPKDLRLDDKSRWLDENLIPIESEKKEIEPIKIRVKIKDDKYIININPVKNAPNQNWISLLTDKNKISIDWNTEHKFFKVFINNSHNLESLYHFLIAFVLSEVQLRKIAVSGKVAVEDMRLTLNKLLLHVVSEVEDIG